MSTDPRTVLAALGTLVALAGVATGGVSLGYGKVGAAYLVHLGLCWLLIAGALAAPTPRRVRSPAATALVGAAVAVASLWLLALGLVYWDLVLTPPPYYDDPPTLAALARDRLAFVLALAPAAVGPVRWRCRAAGAGRRPVVVAVGGAVLSVAAAVIVARSNGGPAGITTVFYGALGLVSLVAGTAADGIGRALAGRIGDD